MTYTDEQIYAVDKADYLPVFARYQIVLDHGDGVNVYDTAGKKYIDFLGGIAVELQQLIFFRHFGVDAALCLYLF